MDGYFCMAPNQKVWWQKMVTKQSRSQQAKRDITRPIATNDQSNIYHFKKPTMEKLTSQARIVTICIGFYCDMKPTSKTVVP
jgi:hypothetical protein